MEASLLGAAGEPRARAKRARGLLHGWDIVWSLFSNFLPQFEYPRPDLSGRGQWGKSGLLAMPGGQISRIDKAMNIRLKSGYEGTERKQS